MTAATAAAASMTAPHLTDGWTALAIVGLAAVTVITRCLFFLSARPLPMPRWLERGHDDSIRFSDIYWFDPCSDFKKCN